MRFTRIPGLRSLWPLPLVALVGAYANGFATSLDYDTLKCPVCGTSFEITGVTSTNNFEGQDADFFSRAAGADAVLYYVSTCPGCLYSGFPSGFADSVVIPTRLRA